MYSRFVKQCLKNKTELIKKAKDEAKALRVATLVRELKELTKKK